MKNKLNNELAICGLSAVNALVENHGERVRRFYFTEEHKRRFSSFLSFLASKHVPYNLVEAEDLEKLSGTVHHQGVVAMISPPDIAPLKTSTTDDWIKNGESALILDRIGNANNLGAIVRSAAFFGVKNIVISLDAAQSSISTATYRVAEGGMESVEIYSAHSLVRLLSAMNGKMVRIGTEVRANKNVSEISKFCTKKGALIVLGNEENGISREVRENCDYLVRIPSGGYGKLESLNVAQAAAIILYESRNIFSR